MLELLDFVAIVLQINLKDITKRPLQMTARLDTMFSAQFVRLKLIGEELWCCHDEGITVYDCQWNKLREIRLGRLAMSVAALDTKTVVIATFGGLVTSSTLGVNIRAVNSCIFFRLSTVEDLANLLHYIEHCKLL